MGTAEIAQEIFFSIPSLLMANNHNLLAVKLSQTGNDRLIIAKEPVPVQFTKVS